MNNVFSYHRFSLMLRKDAADLRSNFIKILLISFGIGLFIFFMINYSADISGMQEFGVPVQRKFTELSFGQRKKAFIAFALAANTKLLLLDEPTNGLDIPSKSQFRRLVANALTDENTFMVSTHQVRDLENLIDPIIILDNNEVLLNHSVEEISQKFDFGSDFERLFNAVIADKAKFRQLFN